MQKNKKRVVILGSKPEAIIPQASVYVCANYSAYYYKEKLADFGNSKIYTILSASEVLTGLRADAEHKDAWVLSRLANLQKGGIGKTFVYNSEFYPNAINVISNLNLNIKPEYLPYQLVLDIQKKLLNKTEPFITIKHFEPNFRYMIHLARAYVSALFLKVFSNELSSCSGFFRPSTGVLALLYAIHSFGENAEYILAGVGLTKRGFYPDNNDNKWTSREGLDKKHTLVDRHVINLLSLAKIYDISTTEDDLTGILKQFRDNKIC